MLKVSLIALAAASAALVANAAPSAMGDEDNSDAEFARSFADAKSLKFEKFTGTIEIAVGGDAFAVIMSQGDEEKTVDIAQNEGVLTISGADHYEPVNEIRELSWRYNGKNALKTYLENFPTVKISVPINADISLYKTVATAIAGDGLGHVHIEKGLVEAMFGDVRSADVGVSHSADITLGDVAETLEARIGGSGNIDAGNAGDAYLTIGGSGDIDAGTVAGDVKVKIGGSGDVDLDKVKGALSVRVSGSGDVEAKSASGGGEFSIAGSGNIVVNEITGPTSATIAGSGDVSLLSGVAEDLSVSIAGNGRFELDGVSTNLDARITGSGAIIVAKNTGTLHTSGNGGVVRVNGQKIDLSKRRGR
ncbi:MAG: DUF2807 domain-containing protein [Pseudomonadota bacterium]